MYESPSKIAPSAASFAIGGITKVSYLKPG